MPFVKKNFKKFSRRQVIWSINFKSNLLPRCFSRMQDRRWKNSFKYRHQDANRLDNNIWRVLFQMFPKQDHKVVINQHEP